ncbi:hypothetical protein N7478_011940 [Penicillium angulare]|uniref:uncharacterized protein n=1 Tax=Penicillium angulare TaxID=116970 RepID=UPI00254037D4|nr:uncharacterized protein N7478_011940 [Penicillium angulare]KAJ5261345.1 hypothetical protein N7478_011940 [Penicillium angulare]
MRPAENKPPSLSEILENCSFVEAGGWEDDLLLLNNLGKTIKSAHMIERKHNLKVSKAGGVDDNVESYVAPQKRAHGSSYAVTLTKKKPRGTTSPPSKQLLHLRKPIITLSDLRTRK